jgi:glucose/arabinose dehydrogenase
MRQWYGTVLLIVITIVVVLLPSPLTFAQDDEYEYAFEMVTDEPRHRPLLYTEVPDGSGRRFFMTQIGQIYIIEDGVLNMTRFLDIEPQIDLARAEQGLLGLAFHPNFAENGTFYLNYTALDDATMISRFQVSEDNPNLADPESEVVILRLEQPYTGHNGGTLAFGPDGYLYIGMGDGGSARDPHNNGQNPSTLLGAMLRIDVDNPSDGKLYGIPEDNPFADGVDGAPEVWLYGLRNPWRFSFDRETGDMFIGDVGQENIEEIDYVPAGESGLNFGWQVYEGSTSMRPDEGGDYVFPIAEYPHAEGCAVTGGYVYRGEELPELNGVYFYGDFCTGKIWTLRLDENGEWQNELFMDTEFAISSFGEDLAGELYVVDHVGGGVYKLVRADG